VDGDGDGVDGDERRCGRRRATAWTTSSGGVDGNGDGVDGDGDGVDGDEPRRGRRRRRRALRREAPCAATPGAPARRDDVAHVEP
jgi:hypothetical protein